MTAPVRTCTEWLDRLDEAVTQYMLGVVDGREVARVQQEIRHAKTNGLVVHP